MTEHEFGGPWTQIKLDVLKKYLNFYTNALKNKPFDLMYIDGFAGTGEVTVKIRDLKQSIPGSAKIALENTPPFKHLIFIEQHNKRYQALEELCTTYSKQCKTYLFKADANQQLKRVCRHLDPTKMRAVAFIDPFGLEIHWETIEVIANTQCIDMLFLFSLSGLYRQATKQMDDFDPKKAESLDRFLGTKEWREAFYEKGRQGTLFGDDERLQRIANYKDMLRFAKDRMKEKFSYISEPLYLPQKGPPQFALFLAVSNPSSAATRLASRVYTDILKAHL